MGLSVSIPYKKMEKNALNVTCLLVQANFLLKDKKTDLAESRLH